MPRDGEWAAKRRREGVAGSERLAEEQIVPKRKPWAGASHQANPSEDDVFGSSASDSRESTRGRGRGQCDLAKDSFASHEIRVKVFRSARLRP